MPVISRAPLVAIVGRPNVGKSTLFNRLVRRRRAIVGNEPGITRDRLYGEAEWRGHRLRVVDTGGILPEERELIPAAIYEQARIAVGEAAAVVLVVDGRTELAAPDLELARRLRRTGKPLFLAVNKVDSPALEPYAEEFRRLGVPNLYPVSAEHGTGVAELLDAILAIVAAPQATGSPESKTEGETAMTEPDAVAIIGRPNVGKSTLLNALTGAGRAIVSPIPGTTRDAVDEVVERNGTWFRFIDTAGIRRKGKTRLMAEKLSVVMARKHLEAADIALLVLDAGEGVTALDATIAGYAHESGRSLILVVNKWDLIAARRPSSGGGTDRRAFPAVISRADFEKNARASLKFLAYAPMLFVSAVNCGNTDRIFPELELVARERRKRISTADLNRFAKHVDFDRAGVPGAKRIKIYYLTQAATAPPTFILFTDRKVKLHFAYQRFLENQLRRAFGFVGTPIWIKTRESR
jgi:GTP-binding protein